jgi:hypothetical protein
MTLTGLLVVLDYVIQTLSTVWMPTLGSATDTPHMGHGVCV